VPFQRAHRHANSTAARRLALFQDLTSFLREIWMLWLDSSVFRTHATMLFKSTLSGPFGRKASTRRISTRTASICVIRWIWFDIISVSIVYYCRFETPGFLLACLPSQSFIDFWSLHWWPDVQICRFFYYGRN